MERVRMILLFVGLASVWAAGPVLAQDASCSSCTIECPCACSPLAAAWVARVSTPTLTNVLTFKFAPVNTACTRFVVNAQATIRPPKVLKAWPDANDITEFVGTACMTEEDKVQFTATAYGIQRRFDCLCNDKIAFIAVMSGTIDVPPKEECKTTCVDAECGDRSQCTICKCNEPNELRICFSIAYFDACQDCDRDGFPDQCDAVICDRYDTWLKRVQLQEMCRQGETFIARLKALKGVSSGATGRAFLTTEDNDTRVQFVICVSTMKDICKAEIFVCRTIGGSPEFAIKLFPIPPETPINGDFCGLLTCGKFVSNDCRGPLQGQGIQNLIRAIEEGRATLVISTNRFPNGEIGGLLTDP
jgi:hypothetical protein